MRLIPQFLASAKATIDDGYIVAARGRDGERWRADDRLQMRSALRRLTHVLVLCAAAVPVTFTIASARPAPHGQERLGIQLPQSELASMAAAYGVDHKITHDTPRETDAVIVTEAPAPPTPAAPSIPSPAAVPAPGGARGVFPYGYCTWYVSTRRLVPWSGDAGTWFAAAMAMGFPVGSTPRPGAIMVSRESWIGHVAYVESVNGSTFVISEMNYRGFGVVDQRTITLGQIPLIGFIY